MVYIILVNYNGFKDTLECIESLKKIENVDNKIIVVDNCSTDNSYEKLEELKAKYEFVLIKAESNDGFSSGNNLGIKYAMKHNADYVLLLNNDTLVEKDFLERLLEAYDLYNDCGLAIGKILYEGDRNKLWYAGGSLSKYTGRNSHHKYNMSDNCLSNNMEEVTFATGCCMLLSRQTIEKVGFLDEDYFMYEEDADYSFRISKYKLRLIYVPTSKIYHKVSTSAKKMGDMQQYYSIRNKYIMIKKNYNIFAKFVAYPVISAQYIVRIIKGKIKYKVYIKAVKAFAKGERGIKK